MSTAPTPPNTHDQANEELITLLREELGLSPSEETEDGGEVYPLSSAVIQSSE